MFLHLLTLCVRPFQSEPSLRLFMEAWNISQAQRSGFHANGKIILSRSFGEKECLGV